LIFKLQKYKNVLQLAINFKTIRIFSQIRKKQQIVMGGAIYTIYVWFEQCTAKGVGSVSNTAMGVGSKNSSIKAPPLGF